MKVWMLVAGLYDTAFGVFSEQAGALAAQSEMERIGFQAHVLSMDVDEMAGWVAGPVYTVHVHSEEPNCVARHAVRDDFRHPEQCVCDVLQRPDFMGIRWISAESPISYEDAERAALERREEWLATRGDR